MIRSLQTEPAPQGGQTAGLGHGKLQLFGESPFPLMQKPGLHINDLPYKLQVLPYKRSPFLKAMCLCTSAPA